MMFRVAGPAAPKLRIPRSSEPCTAASRRADRPELRAAAAIAAIDMALARFPAVECRSAATSEPLVAVDKAGRVISIVVVPYETPADVMFRGAVWREVFSRSAFADLGSRPVRVNRGHDRARTIGKVISFDPSDRRGLVAELRIARTALGDETLTLASEDCLSASIGFSVPVGGEILDYRTRLRRVNRAVVDHIALVEDPAYADAAVLAVG